MRIAPVRLKLCLLPLAGFLGGDVDILAEDADAPDKSAYHLFNPTPRNLFRELSADRPDKTDSPFTVDAGHFQLEMDIGNQTRDHYNIDHTDVRIHSYQLANMNLKVGVLNDVDFQLVVEAWNSERIDDRANGAVTAHSGFGDITPRVKWNLWGNDGGATALGLMPYVKFPTSQGGLGNDSIEPGLKIPLGIDIPNWDLGFMFQIDYARNGANSGYHTEWSQSITGGHKLIGKLSLFGEIWTSVSREHGDEWQATFDTWLTYDFTKNFRADAGVYIGLTRSADDLQPFFGLTWRY